MAILTTLIMIRLWLPDGLSETSPEVIFPEAEVAAFLKAAEEAEDSVKQARTEENKERKGYSSPFSIPFNGAKKPEKIIVMIELNSTDTLELQQLRGIGPGFARRIISYRERLGGFYNKRQMLEVFGMDTARYNLIAENLMINPDSIKRMPINAISLKEMMRHPYFPYPLARKLIEYRYRQKAFKNLEEVKPAAGLSDSLFRRMIVYLRL
jgi:DNA uptake protein ComE-like DNA-binding protein